jgi:hypothetical protein
VGRVMQERGGEAAHGLRECWCSAAFGRAQLWLLAVLVVTRVPGAAGACTNLAQSCHTVCQTALSSWDGIEDPSGMAIDGYSPSARSQTHAAFRPQLR